RYDPSSLRSTPKWAIRGMFRESTVTFAERVHFAAPMPVHSEHTHDHAGEIPALLRRSRIAKGLSLRELAAATGVSAAHLSNMETGKAGADLAQLVQFAEVLGVALSELLPASSVQQHFVDRGHEMLQHTPPLLPRIRAGRSSKQRYHNSFWPLAEPFAG